MPSSGSPGAQGGGPDEPRGQGEHGGEVERRGEVEGKGEVEGRDSAGFLEHALSALHRVEDAFLAGLLLAMIVLAPTQIVLRNFFDTAISWGDPALRALVLWIGLLGALAATRGNRHITIDVLSHVLPERLQAGVRTLTNAFALGVCGLVAYHGWRFVRDEHEFQSVAFAGVPSWAIESVIPFAFAAIALRYLGHAAADLRTLVRGENAAEAAGPEGPR